MTSPAPELDLAKRWLRAAHDAGVRASLEAVYADVGARIAERAPACWASGRCCNFEKAGHRLYVTGLEAAYTLVRAPAERAIDAGLLTDAVRRGGCPFQVRNLCGVHTVKPLACRVYFCDRTAKDWQLALSEEMHERVRALHTAHAVGYRYAEWRSLLAMLLDAGGTGPDAGVAAPPVRDLT